MSQQFLHYPEVRPAVQQMRRESMTDSMRVDSFIDAALFGILLYNFLNAPLDQLFVRND